MSDTPETDAYAKADWWTLFRATEHSRILERERDEVRQKYDILSVENMLEVNKLCKERDDITNQLIHLRSCVYDVIHSLKAGAFDELEKAWKEGLK